METEYVYRMLNLLTELPLQQGELDEFTRSMLSKLSFQA